MVFNIADSSAINQLKARMGANLRRERLAASLSQEELAFRANLHPTEIGLLERGKRSPALGTILKLAGCLDIDLRTLSEGLAWRLPAAGKPGYFEVTPFDDQPSPRGDDGTDESA